MSNEIKIESGPRREFSTGAKKQASSGKGTPVLVPGDSIIDVAKHFEGGADIYGPRNWEKGIPLSEILNSLERHLQQEKMGLTDEPHARALAWNAMVYLATKLRIENGLLPAELNDMPNYEPVAEPYKEAEEETLDEVVAINEENAEELEPKEDEERSDITGDGTLYCNEASCFERGFPKKGSIRYYCPKHKKGD